jgi:outer membrane beta-barrel protein
VQTLSDLATLAPFSDVAVIQRRFLPKTNRFELSASAYVNLNNPFFNQFGLAPRVAYYLRESYALEAIAGFGTVSARQVTDDLAHNRSISTDHVASSRGFALAAFKWNPVYGKITWLNKTIVPFDLNFDIGGGVSFMTGGSQAPTAHLGTSQVFALSKGMAFRWDLIVNNYNATITETNGSKSTLNQFDVFLGLGMSFYFPEATYR